MSRKPLPYMRLYVEEWELDTLHLTAAEDGAYGRIVRHYWREQRPPHDTNVRAIARVDVETWDTMRSSLAPFFKIGADGMWKHTRVEAELKRTRTEQKGARKAGIASGKARKAKADAARNERSFNDRSTIAEPRSNRRASPAVQSERNSAKPVDAEHRAKSAALHAAVDKVMAERRYPPNGGVIEFATARTGSAS